MRTRVGYTGGEKANPTYYRMGDHTETLQIDYDPSVISYGELLDIFWRSHAPFSPPWGKQYRSAIFYHNEEQKRLAEQTRDVYSAETGREVYTGIEPAAVFYMAEDYHQKYRLQHTRWAMRELKTKYPNFSELVDSTAAARLNGLIAGYGTAELVQEEIDSYGLSAEATKKLLRHFPTVKPISCAV